MPTATDEPRMLTAEQVKRRQRTAFGRALDGALWKGVQCYAEGEYGVTSSDGSAIYLVSLSDPERGGRPSCSCRAGYHDVPCKHIAAVLVATVVMGNTPESWRDALLNS